MGRKYNLKKEINLSKLPKYKEKINWSKINYHTVNGVYNNIEFSLQLKKYDTNTRKLIVIYNNEEFFITSSDLQMCKLGKLLNKYTGDFKIKIGQTFKDQKRDITIIDREYRIDASRIKRKYYKYKCNSCGFDGGKHWSIKCKEYKDEYWIAESNLISGIGCACCSNQIVVEDINSIYHTTSWMIPYIGEDNSKIYTNCSDKKIKVVCTDCGNEKLMKISNLYNRKSVGCICGDGKSYISKYVYNLLKQLNINFETETKYKWNKYKTFDNKTHQASIDFLIYSNNRYIPLETDGDFHRKDNSLSGQTSEESSYIDNQRDYNTLKYLNEKTIRISDEGNIKQNILNSELNKMFDLSKIDWNTCEEFALSNLVKEACNLKKNNPNLTTIEIGKLMGYNCNTICRWLKKGNNIGWCNFTTTKYLIILKDVDILGVYSSSCELERKSLSDFNIKLDNRHIYNVCNGKKSQYKGYIFKYIKNLTPEEYIKYNIENKLNELHNKELVQAM